MNSNPLISVMESYEVSIECLKMARIAILEQQSAKLIANFNRLSQPNAQQDIAKAITEVSDLFVFSLWANFERFVITYLQDKTTGLQQIVTPITLASPLFGHIHQEIEFWHPKDILELLKNIPSIDKNAIGKAKQILEYRNWIAHGKDVKKTVSIKTMTPAYTYQTLNEIVRVLLLN